jgi:sugar (pentulose or hexulose) kinase
MGDIFPEGGNPMTKQLIAALALTALILAPMSAAFANDGTKNDPAAAKKSHDVYATVVAVDPDAKTLTFRGPDGNEQSGEVKGDAVNKLRDLRPGQQVTLVLQDQAMSGSASGSAGGSTGATGTATSTTNPVITDIKLEKASGKKG